MQYAKFGNIIAVVVALSLSACTSNQSSAPVQGSNGKHTFVIGNQVSTSNDKSNQGAANTAGNASAGSKESGKKDIGQGEAGKESTVPGIKGSGKWVASVRRCENFQSVELRDCIKMLITAGKPLTVSVESDDNLADLIETRVEGGKLIVSAKDSFQAARAPEVVVTVPNVNEIMHKGTGDLIISEVKSPGFFIDSTDLGTCYVGGRTLNERINLTGEGKVDCSKLLADRVTVEVSGSGDCLVAPLKQLDAKLTGKGNILYVGEPALVRKSDTGSGSIKPLSI